MEANETIKEILQADANKKEAEILKVQKSYIQEQKQALLHEQRDKLYYEEYVKVNKGKPFIDIDQIDNLGLPYDILIITSIKNTGKTRGILYKQFLYHVKKGQKIFFLRSSEVEVKKALPIMTQSPFCPFDIRTYNGNKHIFLKEKDPTDPEKYKPELTNIECGQVANFKNANFGGGGEYDNYGAIMYDECCAWDGAKRINETHYLGWAAFISSVTRNKKEGIKVYCMGNLTGMNMGLLEFYGIRKDDRLRYIERKDPNDPQAPICKILYINVNDIYKGIQAQVGAVQGMSANFRHQLFENDTSALGKLIVNTKIWDMLDPLTAFLVTGGPNMETYVIEIRKTPYEPTLKRQSNIYVAKVQLYGPHLFIPGDIYTSCPVMSRANDAMVFVENLDTKKFILFDTAKNGILRFYDAHSQKIVRWVLKNIKNEDRFNNSF